MSTITDVAPVPATRTTDGRDKEKRRERAGAALGVLAWVIGFIFILPILYMLLTSFHAETGSAQDAAASGRLRPNRACSPVRRVANRPAAFCASARPWTEERSASDRARSDWVSTKRAVAAFIS